MKSLNPPKDWVKNDKKVYSKDFYRGLISGYSWNSYPTEAGAQFTPLMGRIDSLKKKYPSDIESLDVIRRRLAYIISLKQEMEYLMERYDFDKNPHLDDWLTIKFEDYMRVLADLCLVIVEYYSLKKLLINHDDRIFFEDLLKHIIEIDSLFGTINFTLHGFIITNIRHEIVHSSLKRLFRDGDTFYIEFTEDLMHRKQKFGIMEAYVKDVYDLFGKGIKKTLNSEMDVVDERFPFVTFRYKLSKKGTIIWEKTKITVKMDIGEFLKMTSGFIFLLSRTLFYDLTKP